MRKFSIITVCRNERENIRKTISSVLRQSYQDYEYLICDGGSSDGTADIAASYAAQFDALHVPFQVYSEQDGGVYDGMNHGIQRSAGEYILFLNAGDAFYHENVLESVAKEIEAHGNQPGVYYGDVMVYMRGFQMFFWGGDHGALRERMSIPHQAIFAPTEWLQARMFDTKYRIAADYDLILECYIRGKPFIRMPLVISSFDGNGVSSLKQRESCMEGFQIMERWGLSCDKQAVLKAARRNEWKLRVKRALPEPLWRFWNQKIRKRPPSP